MDRQQCPNCNAPMNLFSNRDGTDSYQCAYCGTVVNNRPKTVSDKVFAFINRAANALKEDEKPLFSDPAKQAAYDERLAAANKKREEAREKYLEKRLKAYEKYVDKHSR